MPSGGRGRDKTRESRRINLNGQDEQQGSEGFEKYRAIVTLPFYFRRSGDKAQALTRVFLPADFPPCGTSVIPAPGKSKIKPELTVGEPLFRKPFFSCEQTWVTRSPSSRLGSGVHNFQRLRGLGGQSAELGILRRCFLRGWGGKMRPAGSDGETVLSSCSVSSRPRLPALTTLVPEPRHCGIHRTNALWIGLAIIPNKCHPACLQYIRKPFSS